MLVRPFPALLLVLLTVAVWSQEAPVTNEPTKLPRAIQQTIDQALAEVAKSRQQYDKAAKAVADRLVAQLKKEQEAATKAGQLDLAVALKQRIQEVTDGDLTDQVDHQTRSARDAGQAVGGAPNPRKAIVGLWTWNLLKIRFSADGLATIQGVNLTGTWSVDKNGRSIRLSWGGQAGDLLDFLNPNTIQVTNGKGEKTIATRVVE